jgi:hypothetical protein
MKRKHVIDAAAFGGAAALLFVGWAITSEAAALDYAVEPDIL